MQIIEIKDPKNIDDDSQLAVGIDFGTTNSLICICKNNVPLIIPSINKKELVPSVVEYEGFKISSIKRLFGKSRDDVLNSEALLSITGNFLDYSREKLTLNIGGKALTPSEIAAEIFKKLKNNAEKYLKTKIEKAVVTMPAYFDDAAKGELISAARLAGFQVLRLLAEPTAAAYAYGINKKVTGRYLVYDFGGGTFDVSLINIEQGVIQVIALSGDNMLGGDDIDLELKNYLMNNFKAYFNEQELPVLAKKIKEHLTFNNKFSYKDLHFTIDEFESVIGPIINKTIDITKEIWEDTVEAIILVGGSSKIPLIKKMLGYEFNCKILADLNPDLIVAQGAGLQAENLTSSKNMLLIDAVPLSLGLELYGGTVEKVIERNSPLPISVTKEYTTYADNQHSLQFHIVQGEREFAKDCRSLARFELGPLMPARAGNIKIEVTFALDADGILSVVALDAYTTKLHEVQIKPTFGIDKGQIEDMLENAYKNATNDYQNVVLKEKILKSEFLIKNIEKILQIMENAIEINSKTKLKDAIIALQSSISVKDIVLIDQYMESLNKLSEEFFNEKLHSKIEEILKGKKIN